jgi:hypothetical protein
LAGFFFAAGFLAAGFFAAGAEWHTASIGCPSGSDTNAP